MLLVFLYLLLQETKHTMEVKKMIYASKSSNFAILFAYMKKKQ